MHLYAMLGQIAKAWGRSKEEMEQSALVGSVDEIRNRIEQFRQAAATPIRLSQERLEGLETSYFLDVMNDEVQSKLDDHEKNSRYIYTTLHPDLQLALVGGPADDDPEGAEVLREVMEYAGEDKDLKILL